MTPERTIINAQIKSTMLGVEDHGFFTFWLNMAWPGGGQSFGGYILTVSDKSKHKDKNTAFGVVAIRKVLETVGVEKWEDLPGKFVRMEHDWGRIYRISNILEQNKWLDLEELSKEYTIPDDTENRRVV